MKLKKTKQNTREISDAGRNAAGGYYIAIVSLSLLFFMLWYSAGSTGRLLVAGIATLSQGPSSILLQRVLLGRKDLHKHELCFSLAANVITNGGLNYLSFVFTGPASKLVGLDGLTLVLAAMFTILGTFSWFLARKLI